MQTQPQNKVVRKSRRMFAALLVVAVVGLCGYQMSTAKKYSSGKSKASTTPATQPVLPSSRAQQTELIDGSKNPEKIPDHVAYGMIFRVIGNTNKENEKKNIRAYINQLGLGAQKCISCDKEGRDDPNDPDSDALIAAAQAYNRQVSSLDMQAKAIKDATWRNPTPEAIAELAKLQKKKESLIKHLVTSLHRQLSPEASARLTEQVNVRVKRRVQIRKKVDAL
jgi:hypothetical protein